MREMDGIHVWIGIGLLGPLLLGIVMIPLRTLTPASNLAFVFLAFTIVVAELGGRTAALVTAVASATSLDFFLTEPYLRLTMDRNDDVIAFLALGGCGLIAAAFGKRRGRWTEVARRAGDNLDIVRMLIWQLRGNAPLDEALETLRQTFRLRATALRDANERVVAIAGAAAEGLAIPMTRLDPDRLVPVGDLRGRIPIGPKGIRLPAAGGRLRLRSETGTVALDLWAGAGTELGPDELRTL